LQIKSVNSLLYTTQRVLGDQFKLHHRLGTKIIVMILYEDLLLKFAFLVLPIYTASWPIILISELNS